MTADLRPPTAVRADTLRALGLADDDAERLRILEPAFDGSTLLLRYELDGVSSFEERFTFHGLPADASEERWAAAATAARFAALFAATSYYKALIPPVVEIGFPVSDATADLVHEVFVNGLGEFAYRNGTSLQDHIRLERSAGDTGRPADFPLADRPLVPVGGGKDSVVTLEAMREGFDEIRTFAVNPSGAIVRTVEHAGAPHVSVERRLDGGLFELNERGALNGHVPITSIVSTVAAIAALLCGDRWVVFSNEASADTGNLTVDGVEVNHQYAKSWSFERQFAARLRDEVHGDLGYLSFLRPLSELTIARAFARLTDYHGIFNSCNRAFKLRGETTDWCGDCPKCRFVFLVLAPFMDRDDLLAVFSGRDLLDDPSQREGFRELLGLEDVKPWECVGTFEESGAALDCLAGRPEWSGSHLVADLATATGCERATAIADDFDSSRLPAPFKGMLDGLR